MTERSILMAWSSICLNVHRNSTTSLTRKIFITATRLHGNIRLKLHPGSTNQAEDMHSYGHAEFERLQGLQRDVRRLLANAESTGETQAEPAAPAPAEGAACGQGAVASETFLQQVQDAANSALQSSAKRRHQNWLRLGWVPATEPVQTPKLSRAKAGETPQMYVSRAERMLEEVGYGGSRAFQTKLQLLRQPSESQASDRRPIALPAPSLENAESTGARQAEPAALASAGGSAELGRLRTAEMGAEPVAPRPAEGSARLALKRKSRSRSRPRNEDSNREVAACCPAFQFRPADHRLCRQVHEAARSILQQAVACKEGEWKRRNFIGKNTSLPVPSPPRSMLRTSELNNFTRWAVEEVQDYSPEYLSLLNSMLQDLVAYGSDQIPAGRSTQHCSST